LPNVKFAYRMRQLNPENSKKYFVSLASEQKKLIK